MAEDKMAIARISAMQYALKIAEEKGIDALRKEVEYRSRYKVPFGINNKEVDAFTNNVKNHMFDTMKRVVSIVLHDEYGFSTVRLNRFYEKFEEQCECVMKNYVTLEDMATILEDECKVKMLPIRVNDKNVKVDIRKKGKV